MTKKRDVDESYEHWEGRKNDLQRVVDGDHGLMSSLAEQILERLDDQQEGDK